MMALVVTNKADYVELGLRVESVDFKTWAQLGSALQQIERSRLFWFGDWWNYGENRFGEEAAEAIQDETGYDKKTLQNAAYVCSRIPLERRHRPPVTFSHHAVVAPLPPRQQDYWLTRVKRDGLTVSSLRVLVKGKLATPKPAKRIPAPKTVPDGPIPSPPDPRAKKPDRSLGGKIGATSGSNGDGSGDFEMWLDVTLAGWATLTTPAKLTRSQIRAVELLIGDLERLLWNTPRNGRPSLSDVETFVKTKGLNVDPRAFFEYQEETGWMVGKKKMKNWMLTIQRFARENGKGRQRIQVKVGEI